MAAENNASAKTEELTALVQEIRDRVRARYPGPDALKHLRITLPDLLPLVHARDAAEAKVAAIGTVNPRAGGLLNAIAQAVKKAVARALDWHVREQVEFNRHVMSCVESTLEALNETKRSLSMLAGQLEQMQPDIVELKDIRSHWSQWRSEWEHKLFINETQFLRSVADLQGRLPASRHAHGSELPRYRPIAARRLPGRAGAFYGRAAEEILGRFRQDPRANTSRLIHEELRIVRQRASQQQPRSPRPPRRPLSPRRSCSSITAASPSAFAGPKSTSRRISNSICPASRGAPRCSISAAAAESFWK